MKTSEGRRRPCADRPQHMKGLIIFGDSLGSLNVSDCASRMNL